MIIFTYEVSYRNSYDINQENKGGIFMKHLKSTICVLAATGIVAAAPAMAADQIAVFLNGNPISFDVPPLIINDSTMVPVRAIFEALGANVNWNNETRTVTSVRDGVTVTLTIDQSVMYVNGTPKQLEAPACIIDERTLVPLRAVSEAYGADVVWDGNTRTVYITSGNTAPVTTEPVQSGYSYSYDTLKNDIMSAGVYYEGTYIFDMSTDDNVAAIMYNPSDDNITVMMTSGNNGTGFLIFGDGTPVAFYIDMDGSYLFGNFPEDTNTFTVVSNELGVSYEAIEDTVEGMVDSTITLADLGFEMMGSSIDMSDFGVKYLSSDSL